MLDTQSDSLLLEAVYNNDLKAFNILFERHCSKVYTAVFKYAKDQDTCQEITHDIFLNIWNKRHELDIRSFKSYVITAGCYHGIRKLQNIRSSPVHYIRDYEYAESHEDLYDTGRDYNSGEISVSLAELNGELDTLLKNLPKRCREIYLMSRKEDLSITEIAAKLNISKRTVENQLTIALKHLRVSLKYTSILVFINLLH